jgi:hypothetical protein
MHDCTALKLLSGFLEKIFVSWLTFCNWSPAMDE